MRDDLDRSNPEWHGIALFFLTEFGALILQYLPHDTTLGDSQETLFQRDTSPSRGPF
jgi:hypothetical protein